MGIVGDVRDRGALDAAPDRDVRLAVLLGVLAEGGGLGPGGVVEVRALPAGRRGGAVRGSVPAFPRRVGGDNGAAVEGDGAHQGADAGAADLGIAAVDGDDVDAVVAVAGVDCAHAQRTGVKLFASDRGTAVS